MLLQWYLTHDAQGCERQQPYSSNLLDPSANHLLTDYLQWLDSGMPGYVTLRVKTALVSFCCVADFPRRCCVQMWSGHTSAPAPCLSQQVVGPQKVASGSERASYRPPLQPLDHSAKEHYADMMRKAFNCGILLT